MAVKTMTNSPRRGAFATPRRRPRVKSRRCFGVEGHHGAASSDPRTPETVAHVGMSGRELPSLGCSGAGGRYNHQWRPSRLTKNRLRGNGGAAGPRRALGSDELLVYESAGSPLPGAGRLVGLPHIGGAGRGLVKLDTRGGMRSWRAGGPGLSGRMSAREAGSSYPSCG